MTKRAPTPASTATVQSSEVDPSANAHMTRSSTKAASEGASSGPEKPKPSKTRAKRSKPTKADAGPPEKLPPESEDDQDSSAPVGIDNSMAGIGGEAAGVVAAMIAASATTTPTDSATSAVTPIKSATSAVTPTLSAVTPTDTAVTPTDTAITPTDAATSATNTAATTATPSPRLTAITPPPPHSATTAVVSPLFQLDPDGPLGPHALACASSSPSANRVPSLPLIAVLPPDPSSRRRRKGATPAKSKRSYSPIHRTPRPGYTGRYMVPSCPRFPIQKARNDADTDDNDDVEDNDDAEDDDDTEDDNDAQDDDDAEDDNRWWGSGGPDVSRLEAMRASLSAADSLTIKQEALDSGKILERARAIWDGAAQTWESNFPGRDPVLAAGEVIRPPRGWSDYDYRLSLRRRGLSTPPHSPTATAAMPFLVPSEPSPATAATDAAPTKDPATVPPAAAATVVAIPQPAASIVATDEPSMSPPPATTAAGATPTSTPSSPPPAATAARVITSPTPSTTPPAATATVAAPIEDVHAAIAAANAAAMERERQQREWQEPPEGPPSPPPTAIAPPLGSSLRSLELPGDSHRACNPTAPVQLPTGGKGKGKGKEKEKAGKSTVELNSADLMQEVAVETSKKVQLDEAIHAFAAECEIRAKEIAEELELPLETVRMAFRGDSLLRKERVVNMDHARLWKLRQQIDAGEYRAYRETQRQNKTSQPGDSLPHDLHALRVQVKELVQNNPPTKDEDNALRAEFAKDATWTGDRMYDELTWLERHTGAWAIILIGSSHAQDSIQPTFLATPASRGFPEQSLKISGEILAQMFNLWTRMGMPTDLKKEAHTLKRSQVVQMIESGLKAATGCPDVKMSYTAYHEQIVLRLGFKLVGWPDHIPMVAPSNMKAGASEDVRHLHRLLSTDALRWERAPDDKLTAMKDEHNTKLAKEKLARKEVKSRKRTTKATVQRLKKGGKRKKVESLGESSAEEMADSGDEEEAPLTAKKAGKTAPKRKRKANIDDDEPIPARKKVAKPPARQEKMTTHRKSAVTEEPPAPKKTAAKKRPREDEGDDDQGPAKKSKAAAADLGATITAVLTPLAKKSGGSKARVTTTATAAARRDNSRVTTDGGDVPKKTRKKKRVVSVAGIESSGKEEGRGRQDSTTKKAADALRQRRADLIAQAPSEASRNGGKVPKTAPVAGPSKPRQSQQAVAGPSKPRKSTGGSLPRGFVALDQYGDGSDDEDDSSE
ncbi:hypothetical protein C8J57DRAFT_1514184 [Mycena rebaudengoi]|nr:hypothetical protein C8J57DRAFT_1514184 [Mycena rebaudengoi]